jgi:hypothetical protein
VIPVSGRRFIAPALLCAAVALPASAGAGTKTYSGTSDDGVVVALDVVVRHGKPRKITEIQGQNLPLLCERTGHTNTSIALPTSIKVNAKGKFHFKYVQPTYRNKSRLKGRFDGKVVTGEFSYDYHYLADATDPEQDCATGVLPYYATR